MRALLKWTRALAAVPALLAAGAARGQTGGETLLINVPAPAIQTSSSRGGPITPALAPAPKPALPR